MVSKKTDDGTGGVDELFESLGIDEVRTWRGREVPGGRRKPASNQTPADDDDQGPGPSFPLLAALGLAAVVVLGAVIWLATSRTSEGTETAAQTDTTEIEATAGADAGADATADALRASLASLGFDGVTVEVRDGVVVAAGSVPTEQDLSAVRTTALAAGEPGSIDISGIEVTPPAPATAPGAGPDAGAPAPGAGPPPAGAEGRPPRPGLPPPGAPPPGFVAPTKQQLDDLQRELDRVLTDTPLVYDPGSSTLNELQLQVLDTIVIRLLESHPGVPIRLVGYTDDTGDEYQNNLLSFDRATAAQEYLISRGVPPFIVRAEGRGERNASGEDDADRRIEIEVVDLSAP